MSARNNRFNAALLSLEALCGEADPEKLPWLGDGCLTLWDEKIGRAHV